MERRRSLGKRRPGFPGAHRARGTPRSLRLARSHPQSWTHRGNLRTVKWKRKIVEATEQTECLQRLRAQPHAGRDGAEGKARSP